MDNFRSLVNDGTYQKPSRCIRKVEVGFAHVIEACGCWNSRSCQPEIYQLIEGYSQFKAPPPHTHTHTTATLNLMGD